jgi:hypothetical protein
MKNKQRVSHIIRPQYFLAAALVCGLFSVYALRQNNVHMIQLRNQVYQADKDNGNVEIALHNLREYVYAHMNTNLDSGNNAIKPPIQLKYTYQRLQQASQQGSAVSNDNVIYSQAQAYCEQLFPHGLSGSGRIPCIQQYITSHNLHKAQSVDPSLYQFDFVSASWSFDTAGWLLVSTAILALVGLVFYAAERFSQAQL